MHIAEVWTCKKLFALFKIILTSMFWHIRLIMNKAIYAERFRKLKIKRLNVFLSVKLSSPFFEGVQRAKLLVWYFFCSILLSHLGAISAGWRFLVVCLISLL